MGYKFRDLGQRVPELGLGLGQDALVFPDFAKEIGVNGEVPAPKPGAWETLLTNIDRSIDLGGKVYSKYVSTDVQKAQIDLARTQAETAASQAEAARLALKAAAAAREAERPAIPPAVKPLAVGAGTLALIAAGVLGAVYLFTRRK